MFRNMIYRIRQWLQRFMWGRYGVDRLNLFLLTLAVVLCVISYILSRLGAVGAVIGAVVNLLSYALLVLYLVRALSRNLDARRRENNRYLALRARVTDRQNRYFRCPNCGQNVRVPRGRGKICIRCPKCDEKFIRKT